MIDEKKLIEKIEKEIDGVIVKDTYSKWKNAGLRKARILAEEQPKIGGWIPCSERLPDRGVMNPITNDYAEYLCTVCVDGFRTVRPIKFDKDGCWVNHGMNFDKYVTAWQPLPEEYHG